MTLWNIRYLYPPANSSYKATDKSLDLKSLNSILNEAIDIFSKEKLLRIESAFLNQIIYRINLRCRNDKSFKAASKTNKALKKLINVNFNSIITILKKQVPSDYIGDTYLPTRNLFDHVLVKAQGLGKLLCRIAECARETAFYLENRLHIGHLWREVFMMLSIISRIFVITRYLGKYVCSFYNRLIRFRSAFQPPIKQWVPTDYEFPATLEEFLQTDILQDEVIEKPEVFIKWPKIIIDYDSDVEFMSEYVEIADENNDLEFINEYVQILDDPSDIEELQPQMKAISKNSKAAFNKHIPHFLNLSQESDEDIGEVVEPSKNIFSDSVKFIEDGQSSGGNSNQLNIDNSVEVIDDSVVVVDESIVVNDTRNDSVVTIDDDKPAVEDIGTMPDDSIEVIEDTNILDNSVEIVEGDKFEKIVCQNDSEGDVYMDDVVEIGDEGNQKKTFNNAAKKDVLVKNGKKRKKKKKLAELTNNNDGVLDLSNCKDFENLSNFINSEDRNRKTNPKKCKLKNINKMQWYMLRKTYKQYLGKSKKSKKLNQYYFAKAKELFQSV